MQQILGQTQALDILNAALRSGRVHHAWIFSGPRGVGKFTTAIQMARTLLDPDQTASAGASIQNPQSKTQTLIDSSAHPDLHIVRKELALFSDNWQLRERKLMNIPVDLLRERMIGGKTGDDRIHEAPAYRTAALGHGKVFIIDEAELLDQVGQNSLLKTLEEPPRQTYFFLVTSQPDRLLTTIRSRCQHVRFARLDDQAMRAWFEQRRDRVTVQQSSRATEQSGAHDAIAPNPAALAWIEQFAEGSPGMAELAMRYDFFSWSSALRPMLADLQAGKFPLAMGETMARLVEEFALAWVKQHKNASKDAANKDGARHLFSMLASHVRSNLVERVLAGHDATTWIGVVELVREAERELESNVNLKMLLENLVVQWSQAIAPAGSSRSR